MGPHLCLGVAAYTSKRKDTRRLRFSHTGDQVIPAGEAESFGTCTPAQSEPVNDSPKNVTGFYKPQCVVTLDGKISIDRAVVSHALDYSEFPIGLLQRK